jgi:O-antigen/teichoic acid export membrane protein
MREERLSIVLPAGRSKAELPGTGSDGDIAASVAGTASVTVVKNLAWLLLGPVLRLAISIPLAGFTAQHLGLEGYGEFNLALSLVVMLGVLSNFGLNEVLNRSVAQRPEEAPFLWMSVLAFKAGPLSSYLAAVVSIAWFLGYPEYVILMVLLLGGAQWLISLDNTSRAVFAGRQRMAVLGGVEIVKVVIETALWFTTLYLGFGAVALAGVRLTISALGFAVTTAMLFHKLEFRFSRPHWQVAKALLPSGFRFALTSALQSLYERIGFVLLAAFAGPQAVALVSTATTLTEKIFWFVPSIQGAIFPFFSRLQVAEHERLRSAFARALRYQLLIAVGCGLGASVLGPWVIRIVFPRDFWVAGAVVEILGWACAPKLVGSFLVTILQSLGFERRASWVSAVQCVIFVCAILILVRWWGILGFAWAFLVAETVGMGLQVTILQRAGFFSEIGIGSLGATVACGLMLFFAMAWLPGGRENLVGEIVLLLSFPLLVIVSRGVSQDDVHYLQGLWMNKRPSAA